jgi:putative transposase
VVERAGASVWPRRPAGRGAPLIDRCGGRFADLIASEPAAALVASLRAAETIGRPLGAPPFLDRLSVLAGRDPRPRKRGRKPRLAADPAD